MFVRSALWFWGRRERTGEGWWIDSAARVESRLCFGAPRSALWPFSLSLSRTHSFSLSLSSRTHTQTRCSPLIHTHAYVHAHTLPQGYAYACKDIRGLITIPACTRSRTRKESKGETEMRRNRKRTGCLGTSVLRTVLDFIRFSRVRFSFSWLALELLFAVEYVGDYDIQEKLQR